MEASFAQEKKEAIDDALASLMDNHDRDRDEMLSKHQQAMQDLMADAGKLPSEEVEEKRQELINTQQLELSELEQSYAQQRKRLERGKATELAMKHAQDKLALREKHYQEFMTALNELTPENSMSRLRSIEQARAAAAELEAVKRRLDEQRKENEQKIEEEKRGM